MKPAARFFLNFLTPPAIATGLLALYTCIVGEETPDAGTVLVVLGYAYFFAGIPSLLHAGALACAYRRGWSPQGGRAFLLSTANGLLAGVALGWLLAAGQSERLLSPVVGIFSALGSATGAINAMLHHAFKTRSPSDTD